MKWPVVLRVLVIILYTLITFELGRWLLRRSLKVQRGADYRTPWQRFIRFTIADESGTRLNWNRATAAGGVFAFAILEAVVARKYVTSEKPEMEALIIGFGAALATLGINLGQYGIGLARDVKIAAIGANRANALPADGPPAPAVPPVTTTTVTSVGAPPPAAAAAVPPEKRDSSATGQEVEP